MSRERWPWTQELCDEAKEAHLDAKKRYEQKRPTYAYNGKASLTTTEAGIALLMGIAGLGVIASVTNSGGSDVPMNTDPSPAEIADWGAAAFIWVE